MKYKFYYKGDAVKTPGFVLLMNEAQKKRRPFVCEENIYLDFTNKQVVWTIYPQDEYSTNLLEEVVPNISGYNDSFALSQLSKATKPNSLNKSKLNHPTWSLTIRNDEFFNIRDVSGGKEFTLPFNRLDKRLFNSRYANGTVRGEYIVVPFRLALIKQNRVRFAGQAKYLYFSNVINGRYSTVQESSYENFVATHSSFQ